MSTPSYIKTIRPINRCDEDVTVIIPGAGLGRRMKSYGPKPLISIRGKSLLDRQISLIESFLPKSQIILVCGFKADKVIDKSPDRIIKIENELYAESNVVRSVCMALNAAKNPKKVLLINGDLIFNKEVLENINLTQSSVIIDNKFMSESEVGCIVSDGILQNMMYDLPDKWGQIVFFTEKELELLKSLVKNRKYSKRFMFEVMNDIINRGGAFRCVEHRDIRIMDIDSSKDIKKAEQNFK